jgi:iron(III) transport system ATP-binding protein
MVAVESASVSFGGVRALDGISIDVAEGEILCLVGPSGSGKSTLLRVIAGIERGATGRVRIDGEDMSGPARFVEPERRRVGMVFQDYALFPHLTVAANVAFGLARRKGADSARRVAELLERVGLTRYASSYPHMLSGGERQRVALARALAPNPRVLLMDEPFSSLDARLRSRVRRETRDLLRDMGTTTIIVTHDPAEAVALGDRIALMRAGRLEQCAAPGDLYARPATAFAARFFSDLNEFTGTCRAGRIETAAGTFDACGLADGACARVCVRPQHVRVADGPTAIGGHVVSSVFHGEIDRVMVDLDDGRGTVSMRVFGRAGLSAGDHVFLEIDARHAAIVPDDRD